MQFNQLTRKENHHNFTQGIGLGKKIYKGYGDFLRLKNGMDTNKYVIYI